uniref:WGS project CAEQ00000000 data, annotated contig 905 n=1 Tax=Trypanosoma congolense (strain IL3000) TaxID=1068625 RepID=F9WJG0_TRYCI|nr:unnamed protein product [Trypanosoma congolense IL3000]
MSQPSSLPPRPPHGFSLRSAEKLQQRYLEATGLHVSPNQLPGAVDRVRQNLMRIEDALKYRVRHPDTTLLGAVGQTPSLSNFERIRMGHILADIVLGLGTISATNSNTNYDAVSGSGITLSEPAVCNAGGSHLPSERESGLQCQKPCDSDVLRGVERAREPFSLPEALRVSTDSLQTDAVEARFPQVGRNPFGGGFAEVGERDIQHEVPLSLQGHKIQGHKVHDGVDSDESSAAFSFSMLRSTKTSPVVQQCHGKGTFPSGGPLVSPQPPQVRVHCEGMEGMGYSNSATYSRACESSLCVTQNQSHAPYSESPISPASIRFKSVQSQCSGADSNSGNSQRVSVLRKHYNVDFQRLMDFQRCLREIKRLPLTDEEFEQIGLRYAIPGIREIQPDDEKSTKVHMNQQCNSPTDYQTTPGLQDSINVRVPSHKLVADHPQILSQEGVPFRAKKISKTAGAKADVTQTVHVVNNEHTPSTGSQGAPDVFLDKSIKNAETSAIVASLKTYDKQCLPLYNGGRDIIVKKKDMHVFVAMVDKKLHQVENDLGGSLRIVEAEFESSSSEDEVAYS